ncbi:MSHA biogenesis protein MshN [Shewanella sairae]|uniref:MSHA biogenesis protein MshN n=1 Tax=Shewanella sairae TaxID=190310 RepID=A0ABQ4P0U1_9GAMM|nr:tetratricopeptide repeat protein [Shewanella sairae]MCL1129567.1 tetratricopeptide repeat protein [Shewanella sairae]GIU41043.1 MSHA biogenesis protein MshN [Shewanella sairae]
MSIINKMLKDLDKRQQPHGIESMSPAQMAVLPKKASKKPVLLASLISLVVGGLSVFWVLNVNQPSDAPIYKAVTLEAAVSADTPNDSLAANDALQVTQQPAAQINTDYTKEESTDELVSMKASRVDADKEPQKLNQQEPTNLKSLAASKEAVVATVSKEINTETVEIEAKSDFNVAQIDKDTTKQNQGLKPASITRVNNIAAEVPATQAPKLSISHATRQNNELHSSSNMAVTEVKLSPKQLAQKQMQAASDAQQSGLHSEALKHYEAALAHYPAQHEARRQVAALYYGQNKLAKAEQVLEQGRLLFPKHYEFSLLLSRVLQASGRNAQALLSLNAIPDASDFAVKKWHQQSDLAQKQNNYPVAEQSFRQLAKREPNQGRWWMGLAYALDSQQKYTDAKLAYQQALSQGNLSTQSKVYVDNRLLQLGAY